MEYARLLNLISSIITINDRDNDLVHELFEPFSGSRGEILEPQGKPAEFLYFINKGFLRLFYFEDGNEVTTNINCPPGFITSFTSFIEKTPSTINLQCITDCELLRIDKKNLDYLYRQGQKWGEFARVVTEHSLNYNEQRTRDMLVLNAEQRYQKLILKQPDIIRNVPLQYIASFIGIKPESLSRIRRQIIS
ncbi:Crp/Fnr family transcriptional regulator [Dyadobacter frigoris]|uniref:Crp/Fnr family transcriptional regulator n=1 Tax=Dyadobacter frigoris TaxID=2576211 RepID=A0A4U6D6T6_9BACT|nr:Crp/Fnr family transcriptional regulator [Dyadobacter frigoris]TKT91991.1 Crp/Fnr family transcriptional regulator [Dyadobacter frigoris]GLU53133.1 DNA-binding protein [Dyadobacter frigoris]